MKILGVIIGLAIPAAAYATWGLSWMAVAVAAVVGVVLMQAMHGTGWREILTTAGPISVGAGLLGATLLLLRLFMG